MSCHCHRNHTHRPYTHRPQTKSTLMNYATICNHNSCNLPCIPNQCRVIPLVDWHSKSSRPTFADYKAFGSRQLSQSGSN
ncbi:putative ORFan [Cotonvirus japonicus]|uniref:ORFan n=1 Tax=Cotonvirus japonicus TaxID=2811091 RepID=A0ABM7NTG1_9VIRU|nr:putative ORFan [Cotonvirus japonicus]BCS83396.1 putative ORFan [Cotonvirus japonicus]